jgi:hypothetical protein
VEARTKSKACAYSARPPSSVVVVPLPRVVVVVRARRVVVVVTADDAVVGAAHRVQSTDMPAVCPALASSLSFHLRRPEEDVEQPATFVGVEMRSDLVSAKPRSAAAASQSESDAIAQYLVRG